MRPHFHPSTTSLLRLGLMIKQQGWRGETALHAFWAEWALGRDCSELLGPFWQSDISALTVDGLASSRTIILVALSSIMHVMKSARWGARAPRPQAADLPTSIWSDIQEHMELMDWVRAAGTCKASWAVHLKALKALPYELRDISGQLLQMLCCQSCTCEPRKMASWYDSTHLTLIPRCCSQVGSFF